MMIVRKKNKSKKIQKIILIFPINAIINVIFNYSHNNYFYYYNFMEICSFLEEQFEIFFIYKRNKKFFFFFVPSIEETQFCLNIISFNAVLFRTNMKNIS